MSDQVDVVVIGMGPGGEEVAGRLAEAGMSVVGVEKELLGGECPYWGCVPSKMMIRAADLLTEAQRIRGMAGSATVDPDWGPVARRIRVEATDYWNDKVAVDRFEGKGGRFVRGAGRIDARGTVSVNGQTFVASRAVVVATGAAPVISPIPGLTDVPYWTNRGAIKAETVPASLVVLGGGAVGLELAQVYSRFGCEVTVVEAMNRLLPMEEAEVGEELARVFDAEGIGVRTGAKVAAVARDGDAIKVELEEGSQVAGKRLLVATGRRPNIAELDLDKIGIDTTGSRIRTDRTMRAGEGTWAVGDCTGVGQFTHVAMYQAGIAVADILGRDTVEADYRALPRVTFTDPEVGSVGMTEREARHRGMTVRIGISQVSSSARGWIHGPGNAGFIKLVEDADRGVLVGATSVGPWGGEVLSMLCLAVQAEVSVDALRHMIYAYPTFHRGIEDALRDLVSR